MVSVAGAVHANVSTHANATIICSRILGDSITTFGLLQDKMISAVVKISGIRDKTAKVRLR